MSGLIWVQSVCDCYQAADDKVGKELTSTRKYLLIDCRVAPSESVISLKKGARFYSEHDQIG